MKPKHTLHDLFVYALVDRGGQVVPWRSKHYTAVKVGAAIYFVGHHGALRKGYTVSDSQPVATKVRAALMDGRRIEL